MSAESILLHDAIKANLNGLENLRAARNRAEVAAQKLLAEAATYTAEIAAREDLDRSMQALQAVYPANQTIRFVIPGVR